MRWRRNRFQAYLCNCGSLVRHGRIRTVGGQIVGGPYRSHSEAMGEVMELDAEHDLSAREIAALDAQIELMGLPDSISSRNTAFGQELLVQRLFASLFANASEGDAEPMMVLIYEDPADEEIKERIVFEQAQGLPQRLQEMLIESLVGDVISRQGAERIQRRLREQQEPDNVTFGPRRFVVLIGAEGTRLYDRHQKVPYPTVRSRSEANAVLTPLIQSDEMSPAELDGVLADFEASGVPADTSA